jgi:hypothetical protein
MLGYIMREFEAGKVINKYLYPTKIIDRVTKLLSPLINTLNIRPVKDFSVNNRPAEVDLHPLILLHFFG